MHIEHADPGVDKGWYTWPGRTHAGIWFGYAHKGIDEPHVHTGMAETYLVARGTAEMRIEKETVRLRAGDMIVVEAGEAHTFLSNSPDYLHFVIHKPAPAREAARAEKILVSRERLGL
jgi:mannose-6-phosphate isomerase-like protein (cupin superfamily)